MKSKSPNIKSTNEVNILIVLFFVVTLAEVIAEFFLCTNFIYLLKPLLIPILITVYWKSSGIKNNHFILALLFALMANIFFISKDFTSIIIGSVFFMIYRLLVIYLVMKIFKIKDYLPVFLGSIPFVCIFYGCRVYKSSICCLLFPRARRQSQQ